MKRILIALALLPSTYVQAEAITPKSPVDFCMSGICLLDDSSKYPALHKANAKSLKELNDKSFCKESYYGLQDPIC